MGSVRPEQRRGTSMRSSPEDSPRAAGVPQPSRATTPRIGLVLGAGGAVGHAFHGGVLSALSDATGWDARDAEVIVGTSAGSLVGALLRAGLSGTDLAARAMNMPLSPEGRRL